MPLKVITAYMSQESSTTENTECNYFKRSVTYVAEASLTQSHSVCCVLWGHLGILTGHLGSPRKTTWSGGKGTERFHIRFFLVKVSFISPLGLEPLNHLCNAFEPLNDINTPCFYLILIAFLASFPCSICYDWIIFSWVFSPCLC